MELGKYKHFKGGEYEVLGIATHSETLENLVVYKNERGEFWVRPIEMFLEEVEFKGKKVPRFKFIEL